MAGLGWLHRVFTLSDGVVEAGFGALVRGLACAFGEARATSI